MPLDVHPLQIIGAAPGAYRRVGVVPSGIFDGEHLSGQVLDGGGDWQNVRSDGGTTLDVRLVLKTTDDALIGIPVVASARERPMSLLASRRARPSIPSTTTSASHRCSRRQRPTMPG
jgi:hypothetical protein